ncbi:MAG: ABC transporter ATP-binding protein [Bacillota bacterium]|nr:ABC transporter ATP-binding protein [Bacillota bacterium]
MIELSGISKVYGIDRLVHALRRIDLKVGAGEYVALMGPSGSGKSTLMNIIGCLDRPTAGTYLLEGGTVSTMDDDQLAQVRNRMAGFVFQTFNLLARQTAERNVELPLIYRGVPGPERQRLAMEVLERVGLTEWAMHQPNQLSGGQQQRVAIARALVGRPRFLLADEPTGNLDSRSGQEVMVLFEELNREGMAVMLVTHDERIAHHAGRIIKLLDGRVVSDELNPAPLDATAELERIREQAHTAASAGAGTAAAGMADPPGMADTRGGPV